MWCSFDGLPHCPSLWLTVPDCSYHKNTNSGQLLWEVKIRHWAVLYCADWLRARVRRVPGGREGDTQICQMAARASKQAAGLRLRQSPPLGLVCPTLNLSDKKSFSSSARQRKNKNKKYPLLCLCARGGREGGNWRPYSWHEIRPCFRADEAAECDGWGLRIISYLVTRAAIRINLTNSSASKKLKMWFQHCSLWSDIRTEENVQRKARQLSLLRSKKLMNWKHSTCLSVNVDKTSVLSPVKTHSKDSSSDIKIFAFLLTHITSVISQHSHIV